MSDVFQFVFETGAGRSIVSFIALFITALCVWDMTRKKRPW